MHRNLRRACCPPLCPILAAAAMLFASADRQARAQTGSNDAQHGDILIADQFNNRVVEVDLKTHQAVWLFGDGSDKPGPHSVVGVNDAERVGHSTLISGTGTPPSSPPLPGCSDPVNGCPDNRVFFVDRHGNIFWQYGRAGVSGSGPNELNTPVQALCSPPTSPDTPDSMY